MDLRKRAKLRKAINFAKGLKMAIKHSGGVGIIKVSVNGHGPWYVPQAKRLLTIKLRQIQKLRKGLYDC